MTHPNPFRYFKTSPEIIRLAVMLYIRFPLSLRNERGIDLSHETIRCRHSTAPDTGRANQPMAVASGRGIREDQR